MTDSEPHEHREEERTGPKGNVRDDMKEAVNAGIGVLAALKEAIEETIDDMRRRGELSPERAKEAARTAMDRAQTAFDEAKDRFDFVTRREYEALLDRVAAVERQVAQLRRDDAGEGDIPVSGG